METTTNILKEFKSELRMNDYKGDKWAVAMGAFFDVASHLYEKGNVPSEWDFSVGAAGNHIETESSFYFFLENLTYEELIQIGNFLHRLTGILDKSGVSY